VNVSLSFYNGTRLEQISDSIAVLSSGIINLTASGVTISPTAPSAGGIFSISFVLTNLGTTSASAVTATELPPGGMTAFGSNSVFIGSLAVNTQTPVTLTLSSSATAKGSYVVPIQVSYLNNLRQQVNTTIRVPVTIGAGTANSLAAGRGAAAPGSGGTATYAYRRSSSGGIIIIIAILAVAVVALAVLFVRERKRNRRPSGK
jgi:uncharacterized repeat protein (TIGR01451 family)